MTIEEQGRAVCPHLGCRPRPELQIPAVRRYHAGEVSEVLAHLVVATVFKTAGPCVNRAVGGFDSHAFPLFGIGQKNRAALQT